MYANLTPSVTWSLLEGSSTGDVSSTNVIPEREEERKMERREEGRKGERDRQQGIEGNIWRGEGVMKVQRKGRNEGQRQSEGERMVLTPVITLMYDLI